MTELVVYRPQSRVLVPTAVLWATAVVVVCVGWGAALWVACHVETDPVLHDAALFAHLAALVVGFGAVLTLDAYAALWLLGRRSLVDLCRLAHGVHALIWAGLAGLVVSGVLLSPDVTARATQAKLALVLVIALNGLNAFGLQRRLDRIRGDLVPQRLLLRAAAAGTVSQAAWWGASLIGFLNARA